jgi:hypothetical protein
LQQVAHGGTKKRLSGNSVSLTTPAFTWYQGIIGGDTLKDDGNSLSLGETGWETCDGGKSVFPHCQMCLDPLISHYHYQTYTMELAMNKWMEDELVYRLEGPEDDDEFEDWDEDDEFDEDEEDWYDLDDEDYDDWDEDDEDDWDEDDEDDWDEDDDY